MRPLREPVIVGVAEAPLRNGKVVKPTTVLGLQAEVAVTALAESNIPKERIDGLLSSGAWALQGAGRFPTLTLAEYLGITPRFADSTAIGGAAFEAHVAHAALAIERGYCDVALITYGSLQRSQRSRSMQRPPELTMQFEAPWGLLQPIGAYALAAQRHMYQYGTTSEQLAAVAVAARKWASLNPAATKREPLTIEEVMRSELISDPLRKLDSCLVTDGAGAVVMTHAALAREYGAKPVFVRGYGESQTHWSIAAMRDLTMTPAAESSARAMNMAGVRHEDIDLLQIYDSFTITVILTLEAMGFCPPGSGGEFVASGRTEPGGSLPMNTGGGGLSHCHPGMFGIFLLVEAVRQLRGECGARQVPDARIALVHGTGGALSSAATCILATD